MMLRQFESLEGVTISLDCDSKEGDLTFECVAEAYVAALTKKDMIQLRQMLADAIRDMDKEGRR